jgi:hypothetical protein
MFWGRVEVVLVHPQNGFNSLILNWCIAGCWFTPAIFIKVVTELWGPILLFLEMTKVLEH